MLWGFTGFLPSFTHFYRSLWLQRPPKRISTFYKMRCRCLFFEKKNSVFNRVIPILTRNALAKTRTSIPRVRRDWRTSICCRWDVDCSIGSQGRSMERVDWKTQKEKERKKERERERKKERKEANSGAPQQLGAEPKPTTKSWNFNKKKNDDNEHVTTRYEPKHNKEREKKEIFFLKKRRSRGRKILFRLGDGRWLTETDRRPAESRTSIPRSTNEK